MGRKPLGDKPMTGAERLRKHRERLRKDLSDQEFAKMIAKAKTNDARMESVERENGFAPPQRCDLRSHLRTAEQALECAVKMRDWQIACEGIVLLQQAISRIKLTPRPPLREPATG